MLGIETIWTYSLCVWGSQFARETDKTIDDPSAKWHNGIRGRQEMEQVPCSSWRNPGGLQFQGRSSLDGKSGEGHCKQDQPVRRQEDVNRGGVFEEVARTEDI